MRRPREYYAGLVTRLKARLGQYSSGGLRRSDSLRSQLSENNVDLMLVVGRENLRYLTGFSGGRIKPNGGCLVG